jgi:hypothetical protein
VDPKLRRAYSRCIVEVSRGSLDDLAADFELLLVDLPSLAYALGAYSLLASIRLGLDYGKLRRVIFVLDYWEVKHRLVADKYIRWLRELGLDYRLSPDEPAEIKAARICMEVGNCIVLSRDYDPLLILDEELQPVRRGFRWMVRRIRINRECLNP